MCVCVCVERITRQCASNVILDRGAEREGDVEGGSPSGSGETNPNLLSFEKVYLATLRLGKEEGLTSCAGNWDPRTITSDQTL